MLAQVAAQLAEQPATEQLPAQRKLGRIEEELQALVVERVDEGLRVGFPVDLCFF